MTLAAPYKGLVDVAGGSQRNGGLRMTKGMTEKQWFVGVDWGSENHRVRLIDNDGKRLGERWFRHGGAGLAEMADWLVATSGGTPDKIHVAIEVPHGPIVETLLERGFNVYAINPK